MYGASRCDDTFYPWIGRTAGSGSGPNWYGTKRQGRYRETPSGLKSGAARSGGVLSRARRSADGPVELRGQMRIAEGHLAGAHVHADLAGAEILHVSDQRAVQAGTRQEGSALRVAGERSAALASGALGARPAENAGTAPTRPTPMTASEPFRRSPRRLTFSISHPLLTVDLTARDITRGRLP